MQVCMMIYHSDACACDKATQDVLRPSFDAFEAAWWDQLVILCRHLLKIGTCACVHACVCLYVCMHICLYIYACVSSVPIDAREDAVAEKTVGICAA